MPSALKNKSKASGGVESASEAGPEGKPHRAYVGSLEAYDATGAMQFALMTALGLREHHTLLDVGCGSLCGGRLFIPYLLPEHYYGIEPQTWLVEDGIRFELSEELRRLKKPAFRFVDDFSLSGFKVRFDFMLAQSVLTHVSQGQLERCLSQVEPALKTDGMFAASFYATGDDIYNGRDWIYPDFASYPFKFVVERAQYHGLSAFPLIWTNTYGHYWMVFAHERQAERISWLGNLAGEQRMLRILELTRELNDLRLKYVKLKERVGEADSQSWNSSTGKPQANDPE